MELAKSQTSTPSETTTTCPQFSSVSSDPAASTCSSSDSRYVIPPQTRFQLSFPSSFEHLFSSFDDTVIAFCQKRTTGAVLLFSTTFTFFTSIEVSLITPPTLYALGYDRAAGLCASVLLVLGVVSQVPKKFIFRPRPWMVNRAVPIRKDKTSSFPSRAVVCAVVFSWLIAACAALEGLISTPIRSFLLWPMIVCIAALTAFARINVGAHYPSDTLLGFLLGCLVVKIGNIVESLWRSNCDPDSSYLVDSVVSSVTSTPSTSAYLFQLITSRPFLVVTAVSYLMTLVSIQGFWVKCSYVYGLIMSSTAFRATYLCHARAVQGEGMIASAITRVMQRMTLSQHVRAALPFTILLIFGMAIRAKKGPIRVFAFTLIYFCSLIAMIRWRQLPVGNMTAINGNRWCKLFLFYSKNNFSHH